jgi:hypothetical protein
MKLPYISTSASKAVKIKGAQIIIGKASGHKEMCYTLLGVLYDGTELYHFLILKS